MACQDCEIPRKKVREEENEDSKRRRVAVLLPPFVADYAPYTKGQLFTHHAGRAQHWDTFYRNNTVKGYKDRHYLLREFSELAKALSEPKGGKVVSLFEVGCGVGNAILPLLAEQHAALLNVYALDISSVAVSLVLQQPFAQGPSPTLRAIALDLAVSDVPAGFLPSGGVNFAMLIFVLCSVPTSLHTQFLRRVRDSLEVGGVLYFRDYCQEDMAQQRFGDAKKVEGEEATYVRSNGTLSHFFLISEVEALMKHEGFEVVALGIVERNVENRKLGVSMPRKWIQGQFKRSF